MAYFKLCYRIIAKNQHGSVAKTELNLFFKNTTGKNSENTGIYRHRP
jgi:hypothetical protein